MWPSGCSWTEAGHMAATLPPLRVSHWDHRSLGTGIVFNSSTNGVGSSNASSNIHRGQHTDTQTGRETVYLDVMDHLLMLLLLLCSSEPFRLVGGVSRCKGTLELKHQGDWRPVYYSDWRLKEAADSVRLVNGTSLCSGRLEVKSKQSKQSNQWGSSVCEDVFDQQDAEVVCRELGCGSPSVLQGALYGEVEAPMWTKEFQCGGHESALLDCRISGSDRNTCSPNKAVGLTCSEPVRLVGGDSRCAGTLEVKQGDWRPEEESDWNLKTADVACRDLDCGSAVSIRLREESSERPVWWIHSDYVYSGSSLRECLTSEFSSSIVDLTCSDSVRLVNGTSLCSGRLEVKSNQSNQWWSSVCEDDFDQQDAEVVCRELGCGAPSVLQGALYGEVEAPMWTKEFQCGGHESALLDCRSSGSDRNTCSPNKAVGLTCSEPVRLVGGDSRCAGTLELKRGDWRPVYDSYYDWTLKKAAVFCRDLDCGSAVSIRQREESSKRYVWRINPYCDHSGFALRDCLTSESSSSNLDLICSAVGLMIQDCAVISLQASRGQMPCRQKNTELVYYNLGVPPAEEEGAQGAE
ncbi:CD5 antigen-like [Anarhichas minor]|uniref:CD5 antigen-like n=1 Tax=Anarhichas minor TaxID=65739 RepID=UPI003F736C77